MKKGDLVRAWNNYEIPHAIGILSHVDDYSDYPYEVKTEAHTFRYRYAEPLQLLPELPEGVKIGDECDFYDDNGNEVHTSELTDVVYSYYNKKLLYEDDIGGQWPTCTPTKKTSLRVKKASELMKWCEDRDWIIDREGCWSGPVGSLYVLTPHILSLAGTVVNDIEEFHPDWLEEI